MEGYNELRFCYEAVKGSTFHERESCDALRVDEKHP